VDVFLFILSLLVLFIALAIFANKLRRTHTLHFDLKPNCLLTRWPVVFVTGPRSLFYFSNYWNLYPVFLAEHGYEVFKVHLPWHNLAARHARFKAVLARSQNKKFHFIMDAGTAIEMRDILADHPCAKSVTVIVDGSDSSRISDLPGIMSKSLTVDSRFRVLQMLGGNTPDSDFAIGEDHSPISGPSKADDVGAGFFVQLAYSVHRILNKSKRIPSLNTLGAVSDTAFDNSRLLLNRMQELAEEDYQEDAQV
jgi:hypothetical protein